jgi:aminoglycoside phosphotransferase (APT) family kinase protein
MADRIILSREDASTVASQNSYRSPGGHRGASIFLFRSPPQRCVRANRVLRDCRQPHIIDNLGRTRVVDEQLHPGNLLVSDGHLSGVIDFGDLTCGDPATDVSVLWMLPRSIRSKFEAWAGEEPDALKMRARGWALALGLAYLAHSRDDAAMAALGQRTINAVLDEPLALTVGR